MMASGGFMSSTQNVTDVFISDKGGTKRLCRFHVPLNMEHDEILGVTLNILIAYLFVAFPHGHHETLRISQLERE